MMNIKLPKKTPRDERKCTILRLELIQTCTMIKPNKIKRDISRIKAQLAPRLINPPFNLLKLKHQGLNEKEDSIPALY